jgi:dynactin 1
LEAKRGDDARHIRELENRLSEAEAFVALRPKLQAKLQSLQTDNVALKRSLSDAKLENETFESRLLETQEQLEMAMLDKEVAEEKAEAAEGDLESEKEKRIEYEVELEVWRSGGAEGGAGKDVKSTMAYIQLEKHNERLKEGIAKFVLLSGFNAGLRADCFDSLECDS